MELGYFGYLSIFRLGLEDLWMGVGHVLEVV